MSNLIADAIRRLRTRLENVVARAVVTAVNDAGGWQSLQLGVLAGETVDDAEHVQHYGFSSVPLPGAEAVAVFPGGDRGHPLVVAVDDRRYRPTGGDPGEVRLYHKDGAMIVLRDGGDVEIYPGGGGEVRIGAADATDPVALRSDLQAIYDALSGAAVAAGDGGATFKTNILTALSTAGFPVAAQKVKAT